MKKSEKWLYGLVLLLAVICIEMIIYGGLGIGMVITAACYMGVLAIYMNLNGRKMTAFSKGLMIPIILCVLCFVLFSNELLKVCNVLFLMGLFFIQAIDIFGKCRQKTFLPGWLRESMVLVFKLPLWYMGMPFQLAKQSLKEGTHDKFKSAGKILLGLVIALPMLFILVGLLASSDAAFDGMVNMIFGHISFRGDMLVSKIVFLVILYFPLFSFFYGLAHEEEQETAAASEISLSAAGFKLDFVIVSTIGTLVCLVYLLFCFSQMAYFVSAFSGVLPADYTFAEYARRGFFETLPITAFNILSMLVLGYLAKGEKGGRMFYAKGMLSFITAFALFIIICAFSKMVMYVRAFGLTLWRVYTTWFLALCMGCIILLVIKAFYGKMSVMKSLFLLFTMMYLGLNYANIDYIVAKQNVALYEKGIMKDLSACFDLSSSAIEPIYEAVKEDPSLLQAVNCNYSMSGYYGENTTTFDMVKDKVQWIQKKEWKSWNNADSKAEKYYEEILMINGKQVEDDGTGKTIQ